MPSKAQDDMNVAKADRRRFFAAVYAHGTARVLSKLASAPFERIKVCLQVSGPTNLAADCLTGRAALRTHFRDALASRNGARALWRGCGTHIVGTCVGTATRLSVLRTSQGWAMPGGDHRYTGIEAYARRCAFLYVSGTVALLVAYPLDVAYTCLAADTAQPRRFSGPLGFVLAARREHGIRSLYRGLPLCLGTAFPFIVVAAGMHDFLAWRLHCRIGQDPQLDHHIGGELFRLERHAAPGHCYPWNLLIGAASGFVAQSVTYPLDTLRRRWQHTSAGTRVGAPQSVGECVTRIYANGGVRAFYAGYCVNALKLVPELCMLCLAYFHINASSSFV